MKTKSSKNADRRGRKAGDGILKNIDPQSSPLEKQVMLTYGRTNGDKLAERVRWFRHLRSMLKDSSNRKFVDGRTADILARFHQQMGTALYDFKPDWFQKMADAIKAEKSAEDAYRTHKALLEIAGAPPVKRTDLIYPENAVGETVKQKPLFTIAELCGLLKKRGLLAGQQDAESQRTVRRACDAIGVRYLPGKPGRRRKL